MRAPAAILLGLFSLSLSACAHRDPVVLEIDSVTCPLGFPVVSVIPCDGQRAMLDADMRDGEPTRIQDLSTLSVMLEGPTRERIISIPAATSEGLFWHTPGVLCPRDVVLKRVDFELETLEGNRLAHGLILQHNLALASWKRGSGASCRLLDQRHD